MQSIRRSVFRAVTSSSSLVKPRCITTTSRQFIVRANRPVATTQVLNIRRWSSDEAVKSEEERQVEQEMEQAEESSSGNSVGSYMSDAFEAVKETASETFGARPAAPENPGIYIGNLSFEVTPDELEREFKTFGEIKSIRLATDARGLSKGFAYVEFDSVDGAKAAIAAKDQSVFEGRRMIVNFQIQNANKGKQNNEPSKTLFIGNLAFEMSDADLNKLFREIKNVVDVRVAIDRRTGQPRGFAHADFMDIASAEKGKEYLQGKEVYGRQLRVDFSGGPRERTPDSRGGRDSYNRDSRGGRDSRDSRGGRDSYNRDSRGGRDSYSRDSGDSRGSY